MSDDANEWLRFAPFGFLFVCVMLAAAIRYFGRTASPAPFECAQLLALSRNSADTLYVVVTVRECLATAERK